MADASEQGRGLPEILLLTHGHMGAEMIKSAEMVIGDIEGIYFIPLTSETSVEDYRESVAEAIEKMAEGSIVLTDLFGGTPCNTAAILSRDRPVDLIAGVNLSMLIDSVQLREEYQGGELCRQVLESTRESIRVVKI